jgi:hypothetical protein
LRSPRGAFDRQPRRHRICSRGQKAPDTYKGSTRPAGTYRIQDLPDILFPPILDHRLDQPALDLAALGEVGELSVFGREASGAVGFDLRSVAPGTSTRTLDGSPRQLLQGIGFDTNIRFLLQLRGQQVEPAPAASPLGLHPTDLEEGTLLLECLNDGVIFGYRAFGQNQRVTVRQALTDDLSEFLEITLCPTS